MIILAILVRQGVGTNRSAILGRQEGGRTDQLFWVSRPVRKALRWSNTQLDDSLTVINQIIMEGQRDGGCLLIGSLNHCGKSCLGEYCKLHLARMRRESLTSIPCRRCGKGTQSVTYLCGLCWADRAQKYLVRAEARARRIHRLVMDEIRYRSLWAKKLTFVGL